MRRVITISLNGNSYQVEDGGHEALSAYLATAELQLADNPDKTEVLADLEQAIADKCDQFLGRHKNVVSSGEVEQVLREMGPVDGGADQQFAEAAVSKASDSARAAGTIGAPGAGAAGWAGIPGGESEQVDSGSRRSASAGSGSAASGQDVPADAQTQSGSTKRLYQILQGAKISGICNGLAAYFDIDVTLVRLVFVGLAFVTGGLWILAYIVMMFIIPYAHTSEQHAEAHGWPFNAKELVERAKQNYAQFKDSQQWRSAWRHQRRWWRLQRRHRKAKQWQPAFDGPPPFAYARAKDVSYASHVLTGIFTPILAVINAGFVIALVLAVISLVSHHAILGWTLPSDIPLWAAILILLVAFRLLTSPLRLSRHSIYYAQNVAPAWIGAFSAVVSTVFIAGAFWLVFRHWPEVRNFFDHLPDMW